jgi:hemerythrin-like metal-binding protein
MWTPNSRHVLGFPEMDTQHDYCYRLFDALKPVAALNDRAKLGKLLREIEMYLMFHFKCEEHLMRMYEFPGFAVHEGDHEQVGNRFVRFLDDFDAEALNPAALFAFLCGWLMEHSLSCDTQYVDWIQKRRALEGNVTIEK